MKVQRPLCAWGVRGRRPTLIAVCGLEDPPLKGEQLPSKVPGGDRKCAEERGFSGNTSVRIERSQILLHQSLKSNCLFLDRMPHLHVCYSLILEPRGCTLANSMAWGPPLEKQGYGLEFLGPLLCTWETAPGWHHILCNRPWRTLQSA